MNLIIGNTSQQSYYYPQDYVRISSRNVDMNYLSSNRFGSVYIAFAEQRIYDKNIDYITPNCTYTLDIIDNLLNSADRIVTYTSCELWSNSTGEIDINTEPIFNPSNQYTMSKLILLKEIKKMRLIDNRYDKVVILHPFYFNSIHRSEYFLFGKIFKSIINKEKIQVGNLDFHRDMVHAKFLVKKSMELREDSMVGSGKLFNVRKFIMDLYSHFDMDYFEYVSEDMTQHSNDNKLIKAKVDWSYTYDDLLQDTIQDIKNGKAN